jgi:REP element-mobilizing transposase RayT
MSRGARRAPVFRTDLHCGLFLDLLAGLPERFGVEVHGFALMPNHFHLMLESGRGELSRAMGWLLSRYTVQVNRLHRWDGPIFRGRFHNRVVWQEQHWIHLLAYLHLNPVRAGLVVRPEQAPWTSHRFYAGLEPAPEWLTTTELLTAFGDIGGYKRYLREMRSKRTEAPDGFDVVAFGRGRTVSDADVKARRIAPRLMEPRRALGDVAEAAGVPVASLEETRRGRGGNAARVVAAWWLGRASGLSNVEVAHLLSMNPADVSKAIFKVQARRGGDNPVGRLIDVLEQRKMEIGSA